MLRTRPAARLAAGPGVGIRRDAAPPTPPSRPRSRSLAAPSLAQAADVPSNKTLYADGPVRPLPGRTASGCSGSTRRTRGCASASTARARPRAGRRCRCRTRGTSGTTREASMRGSVGWYRKDFELPDKRAALEWAVRFESVNYRSRVCLNGREIGRNAGAYIPFEMRLKGLRKRGVNRLVVRVDSRRLPTDFPPSGLSSTGNATGGWWNYGGILREVYLREARHGRLRHRARAARAAVRALPGDDRLHARAGERHRRAAGGSARRATYGAPAACGSARARSAPARRELFTRPPADRASRGCGRPKRPYLYPVKITVSSGGRTRRHATRSRAACARVKVSRGRLFLNGRPREPPRRRRARGHAHAGLRGRQRVPRAAASRRPRRSARPCCARTTRCTPTSTSSPTARGC